MIKTLRKKFIKITALALFGVLFLLILAINGLNVYISLTELDRTMDMIIENNGALPEKNFPLPDNSVRGKAPADDSSPNKDISSGFFPPGNREKFFTTRFCTITLDNNQTIVDINTDKIAAISADDAKDYAKEILNNGKDDGWIHNYRYHLEKKENESLLVLLDGSSALSSSFTTLFISLFVALGCYLLILFIIIICSGKVILPIAESYEKQKQFITDAGHELKTPITIISANAELLAMTYGSEDEWIQCIMRQTSRMQNLVSQLVSLSRMDEEQPPLIFQDFPVSDALYDTVMVFKTLCQKCGLSLQADIQPGLVMRGDESSMRQLFSILLDNAVKYCDENGTITVVFKRDKGLFLRISNSCRDVDNLALDKLFDRFYRNDQARTERPYTEKGSYGLGLAIAKSLVHSHRGRIKAVKAGPASIAFDIHF